MSIKIIPVVNPHQKMEGIQNVRPKEIEQMINKAKNVPIKIEGDFVKLQNYLFQVDEFEEMDDPNKKKKKQGKKEDAKKEVVKVDDVDKEEVVDKEEEVQVEEVVEKEELEEQQEEQVIEQEQKESEVDYDDMQKQLQESQQQSQQQQSQQQSQVQKSQVSVQQSSVSQKKKKFQSGYAAMMDDLLNESLAEKEQEISENIQQEKVIPPEDNQKEQEYLKVIKSYQKKLKELNEMIENKQPVLSEIVDEQQLQEELDKTEESFSNKKHLYPGIQGISLYDEFRLPKLVEEQVEYRLQELGYGQKVENDGQKIQELEQRHQEELDNVKQQYEDQIQQLKAELEFEKQRVLEAEKKRYAESEISKVLSKSEVERLYKDPIFSVLSSNLMPSIDSDVSEVMKDESVYLKYRDVFKEQQKPKHVDLVNSNLHKLVTKQEAEELLKQDTDSRVSISAIMDVDGALKMMQQNVNSDIDSIINEQEQQEFRRDPKFNESSLPDSSIQFSIPEYQKLQKLIDSDMSNFQMNQSASIFAELQLEQHPESNRFIISQKIIDDQQKVYDKQVKKLCQKKPDFKSHIIAESIDSSIGSLAQKSIPQNISSNIDSSQKESIIGSIMSKQEKSQLLKQLPPEESSISQVSGDINQVSSGISKLNSLVDSDGNSSITNILNNKSNLKSLSNVSSSVSSVQSYLLLKQQMTKKKY